MQNKIHYGRFVVRWLRTRNKIVVDIFEPDNNIYNYNKQKIYKIYKNGHIVYECFLNLEAVYVCLYACRCV